MGKSVGVTIFKRPHSQNYANVAYLNNFRNVQLSDDFNPF